MACSSISFVGFRPPMAHLVAGYATSHTGMMIRTFDREDPVQVRVHRAFGQLREEIATLAPDVIVMVSSEHLNSFFYDCYPQFSKALGKESQGWGDAGVAARSVPIAGDFSQHLLECGIIEGFDLAWAAEPKLDHGFMCPLSLLTPEFDIPVVPLFMNSSTPPLPTFQRCAALGAMIGRAIEARASDERVVLLAGGGLSHWVATPEMGEVNPVFDRWFLDCLVRGDLDAVTALDTDDVARQAGNGGQEIRNWITAMAVCSGRAEVLCYEPVTRWGTGIALARLSAA